MNDAIVTLVGNLASDVELSSLSSGAEVAKFRLAYNARHFDASSKHWRDGPTQYVDVSCWRAMARNVQVSLRKGMPVVVTGRLTLNQRRVDGPGGSHTRIYADLDATALGPDLSRGRVRFERAASDAVAAAQDRAITEALGPARGWDDAPASPDRIGAYPD